MEFKRLEKENEEQFIWRIGQAKENGTLDADWNQIADIINKEFRADESEYRTEAAYRKPYQQAKRFIEAGVVRNDAADSYISEMREARQEVRKERQKLLDERVALNKVLREQSRRESMYEIVKRAIDEHVTSKFDYVPSNADDGDSDLIIHLTDVHCGAYVSTSFNTFDSNVLEDRLKKYLDEIISVKDIYKSENAYVILGGDMIHGLIYTNLRIEAKENIVQQIMTISDLVSNFVYELSKVFKRVEVYTTVGNHSRATPSKEESTAEENFDLLIPFTCEKELKNIENVCFVSNKLGADIAAFTVRGHSIYATHGDKDTPKNVVYHMTQFARKVGMPLPDICYLGHRHQNGLTTVDDVKVIESGCVDGMDSYAIGCRLVGTPEQTVTVVTEKHRIRALCDIQID